MEAEKERLFFARAEGRGGEEMRGMWAVLGGQASGEPAPELDGNVAAPGEGELSGTEAAPSGPTEAEITAMVADAEARGFAAGEAAANEAAAARESELREALSADRVELTRALDAQLTELRQLSVELRRAAIEESVELAVVLAEHLVGETLAQHPERYVEVVAEALGRSSAPRVRIFVDPASEATLNAHRETLEAHASLAGAEELESIRIAVDPALTPGAFRIEHERGGVDGTLQAALAELRSTLRRELPAAVVVPDVTGDAAVVDAALTDASAAEAPAAEQAAAEAPAAEASAAEEAAEA